MWDKRRVLRRRKMQKVSLEYVLCVLTFGVLLWVLRGHKMLLRPVWPDVAKFRHFGYFLWALAKFFFRKVAKENGEIFGYFLKWAKFLVFNAINHFSNDKNGQFWTFLVKYFNFWAIFKLEISGSFLLWAITWAINKGPKHHKMA